MKMYIPEKYFKNKKNATQILAIMLESEMDVVEKKRDVDPVKSALQNLGETEALTYYSKYCTK